MSEKMTTEDAKKLAEFTVKVASIFKLEFLVKTVSTENARSGYLTTNDLREGYSNILKRETEGVFNKLMHMFPNIMGKIVEDSNGGNKQEAVITFVNKCFVNGFLALMDMEENNE